MSPGVLVHVRSLYNVSIMLSDSGSYSGIYFLLVMITFVHFLIGTEEVSHYHITRRGLDGNSCGGTVELDTKLNDAVSLDFR